MPKVLETGTIREDEETTDRSTTDRVAEVAEDDSEQLTPGDAQAQLVEAQQRQVGVGALEANEPSDEDDEVMPLSGDPRNSGEAPLLPLAASPHIPKNILDKAGSFVEPSAEDRSQGARPQPGTIAVQTTIPEPTEPSPEVSVAAPTEAVAPPTDENRPPKETQPDGTPVRPSPTETQPDVLGGSPTETQIDLPADQGTEETPQAGGGAGKGGKPPTGDDGRWKGWFGEEPGDEGEGEGEDNGDRDNNQEESSDSQGPTPAPEAPPEKGVESPSSDLEELRQAATRAALEGERPRTEMQEMIKKAETITHSEGQPDEVTGQFTPVHPDAAKNITDAAYQRWIDPRDEEMTGEKYLSIATTASEAAAAWWEQHEPQPEPAAGQNPPPEAAEHTVKDAVQRIHTELARHGYGEVDDQQTLDSILNIMHSTSLPSDVSTREIGEAAFEIERHARQGAIPRHIADNAIRALHHLGQKKSPPPSR